MIYQHFYGKGLEKNKDIYGTIINSSKLEDHIVSNLLEYYSEYPYDDNYLNAHGKKMKYPDVHTFFCTENNMCIRGKINYETKNMSYFSHNYIFDGRDFSEVLSDKNKVFNISSYVKKYKKLNLVHFKKGVYSYKYKNKPINSYDSIKFALFKMMFGISNNTIKNFVYAAFKAAKENKKIFITLGKENANLSMYALKFLENIFDALPMEVRKYCGFITYSQKIIDKKYINLVFLPKVIFDLNFNSIKNHYYFDYVNKKSNVEYENGKSEYVEYVFNNLYNNEKIQEFQNTIDRVIKQFDESFNKDIDIYDDLTQLYKIDSDNDIGNVDINTVLKKCFKYITADYIYDKVWFKQIFQTAFEIEYEENLSKGLIPSKDMVTMLLEYYTAVDEPLQKKIIEYLLIALKNSINSRKKDTFIKMINYIFEFNKDIFSNILKLSIKNGELSCVYKRYVSYRLEAMDTYKSIEDDITFWVNNCIMIISTQYYYMEVKDKIFTLLSNEIDLVYRQNYIYSIFDNFLRENLENIYNHNIIYKLANELKKDICDLLIEKIDIRVLSEDDLRHFILTYGSTSEKKDILNLVKNILIYKSKETVSRLYNRLREVEGQQIEEYKELIRNLYINHINETRFEEVIMGFVNGDTFEYLDILQYILYNSGSVSVVNFIKWSQNYKPFIDNNTGRIKREYLNSIRKYFMEMDNSIFNISRMKDKISNFDREEIQETIENAEKKVNNNILSKGINFLKKSFNMADSYSPPYEIVCPYCFEKFNHMEVLFRCTHLKEDDENYALKEDSILNGYRRRMNLSPIDKIEAILYPEKTPLKNLKFNDKVLSELTDKYGVETRKRLCPYCHNELPNTAGKMPELTISVIGAAQCGKSVYTSSLIHVLRNITADAFNGSFIPINNEVSDRFKEIYEIPMFDKKYLLEPTEKDTVIEPLIFQFRSRNDKNPPISVSFYDVSGEGMKDIRYIETFAESIKNSNAIMFLVDPLQMNSIKDKILINMKEEENIGSSLQQGRDVLIGLVEDFISDAQNQKTTIPTAIVVTKSDLLKYVEDDEYINRDSKIFENYNHKNAFDMMEFNKLTAEVEEFVSKADSTFKDAVDVYFENAAYFAVSSLGHNPKGKQIEDAIAPLRVDEPFLWILHELNYIDGRDTN